MQALASPRLSSRLACRPAAKQHLIAPRNVRPGRPAHQLLAVQAKQQSGDAPAVQIAAPRQRTPQQPSDRKPHWGLQWAEKLFKGAAVVGLAAALVLGRANPAFAARTAGRAGGFSGRSSAAMGAYRSGGMSRSYGGGGYSRGFYPAPTMRSSTVIVPSPWLAAPPLSGGVIVAPSGPAVVGAASAAMDMTLFLIFATMAASAVMSARSGGFLEGREAGAGPLQLTKVQIGLVALARQLKRKLDSIATSADTDTSAGLQMLLQETVLALLRNPEYAVYGSIKQKKYGTAEELERRFNAASINERSNYKEETLVNVRGRRSAPHTSAPRPSDPRAVDELIVVTLLVATQGGASGLPERVSSLSDLKQALKVLGGLGRDQVLGVEVMWTPQAEGDHYSRDEIVADFPDLVPL